MNRLRLPLGLALLLALASSLPATAWSQAAEKGQSIQSTLTISLLALNDFHGNILPPSAPVLAPDAANPAGTRVSAGGAAYLSTLVRSLKAQNPERTLVVAAGDMVGASQLSSG